MTSAEAQIETNPAKLPLIVDNKLNFFVKIYLKNKATNPPAEPAVVVFVTTCPKFAEFPPEARYSDPPVRAKNP